MVTATPIASRTTGHSRWLGEHAFELTGALGELTPLIPSFDRAPFGLNPRLDMIVRRADLKGEAPVPTGVVSKSYVLVQHLAVVDALVEALRDEEIEAAGLRSRLTITESGARMAMRVELPKDFRFTPPDEHPMGLTFECFNSVDGTVPLFAVLGWLRFVCSNGLAVGTTHARMRQQHRASLDIEDLRPMLTKGLQNADRDQERLTALMKKPVKRDALIAWVDGPVAGAWGPMTAARVFAIATKGIDGEPSRKPRAARPHEREMLHPIEVPGANAPCDDRYGVAQALAWVAVRRNDLTERLVWRGQISELIEQLL